MLCEPQYLCFYSVPFVSSVVKKNPCWEPAITVAGAVERRPSQQGSSQHFHVVGLIIAVCKYAVPRCGRMSPDARCLKKDVDREIESISSQWSVASGQLE